MSHEPQGRPSEDADLSALLRTMREDRAPDDLEEKLLTAVAVGGAAWAVKSGFFATLFGKLFAATKGSTAATVLGLSLAAAGSVASVQIIATQTAPTSTTESARAATNAPHAPAHAAVASPASPVEPSPIASAVVPALAAPAIPAAPVPRASAPLRDPAPRAELTPKAAEPVDAPAPPPPETQAAPAADALRAEATQLRVVADLVAAGRCGDASVAIQSYRATFPRGQLKQEIGLLEARCAAQK